nr:MAG TPA: IrrE N-terminal-like domain [Caudoviricetes sp.]
MEDDEYYTVVLNPALSADTNKKTKLHEIKHILRRDFDKADCDQVENNARGA